MKNVTEKKKMCVTDLCAVVLFCTVIFLGGLLTALLPDKSLSENENRSLTTATDLFSGDFAKKLIAGDFSKMAGDWCRDQFPLRETALEVRAVFDMALVRYETNGVLYGGNGYLIPRKDAVAVDNITANRVAIDTLCRALEKKGVTTLFALAPRPCDVLTRYYPSGYSADALSAARRAALSGGDATALLPLDLLPTLKNAADRGEYVYYRTDHHWTAYGAYLAYRAIGERLGVTPLDADAFTRETVSTAFYGTSYSTAMTPFAQADTMEYWHLNDGDFVTEIRGGKTLDGFYDRSYLDKKDKYSSYIGGNNAYVTVKKKNAADRPVMVLVKDSYAHAMVPLLARHYDLVIVDPRYYTDLVYRLCDEVNADCLLVLAGLDSLTDTNAFVRLGFGVEKEG